MEKRYHHLKETTNFINDEIQQKTSEISSPLGIKIVFHALFHIKMCLPSMIINTKVIIHFSVYFDLTLQF